MMTRGANAKAPWSSPRLVRTSTWWYSCTYVYVLHVISRGLVSSSHDAVSSLLPLRSHSRRRRWSLGQVEDFCYLGGVFTGEGEVGNFPCDLEFPRNAMEWRELLIYIYERFLACALYCFFLASWPPYLYRTERMKQQRWVRQGKSLHDR